MNKRGLGVGLAISVASVVLAGCSEVSAIVEEQKDYNHARGCQDEVSRIDPSTLAALNTVLRTNPDCATLGMEATYSRIRSTTPEGQGFSTPGRIAEEIRQQHLLEEQQQRKSASDYGGSGAWSWNSSGGAEDAGRNAPRNVCVYSPTMNYDWHDDMVCGGVRQYFLPYDDFITYGEIRAAADEWERRNN